MSWIQRDMNEGFRSITIGNDSLSDVVVDSATTQAIWWKVYALSGMQIDLAVIGYRDQARTDQVFYGRETSNRFPIEVDIFPDADTDPLENYPPNFENPDESGGKSFKLAITDADTGSPYETYYLESWTRMLGDFVEKIKDELEGATWTNAPDDFLLLMNSDLDRLDAKSYLSDLLVVVHSPSEEVPPPDFAGGLGRRGRMLTAQITIFVKSAAGLDSGAEESAIATLATALEDARQELAPAANPNKLGGYLYFSELEEADPPDTEEEEFTIAASLRFVGYKMEFEE